MTNSTSKNFTISLPKTLPSLERICTGRMSENCLETFKPGEKIVFLLSPQMWCLSLAPSHFIFSHSLFLYNINLFISLLMMEIKTISETLGTNCTLKQPTAGEDVIAC
jgi:hypothetical protein